MPDGSMNRHDLSEQQWRKVAQLLPAHRRASTLGDRNFVNAVVYLLKTGCPWRDLPERFGPWKTIYNRFARWSKRGVWARVFEALQTRVDRGAALLDASIARAHQDSCGAKGGQNGTLLAVVVEVFPPRSTRWSTREANHSSSR